MVPMVGNGAIRATGDMKTPALIMITAGVVNIVLDPLLIFGLGPFPRLELQGAAIATVISWVVTFAAAIWILGMKIGKEESGKIGYKDPRAQEMIDRFMRHTDFEFECSEIVGRKFKDVDDHADYLRDGGCSELIEVLAAG